MAIEQAREYLRKYQKEQDIQILDTSSATVELAAQALGTQPERIAKSLSFMGKGACADRCRCGRLQSG